jgi:hypothetical protein
LAKREPEQKQDDNTIQHARWRMFCGSECCKSVFCFSNWGTDFTEG